MKKAIVGLGMAAVGMLIVSKWLAAQSPVCSKHLISKTLINGKLRCAKCVQGK